MCYIILVQRGWVNAYIIKKKKRKSYGIRKKSAQKRTANKNSQIRQELIRCNNSDWTWNLHRRDWYLYTEFFSTVAKLIWTLWKSHYMKRKAIFLIKRKLWFVNNHVQGRYTIHSDQMQIKAELHYMLGLEFADGTHCKGLRSHQNELSWILTNDSKIHEVLRLQCWCYILTLNRAVNQEIHLSK